MSETLSILNELKAENLLGDAYILKQIQDVRASLTYSTEGKHVSYEEFALSLAKEVEELPHLELQSIIPPGTEQDYVNRLLSSLDDILSEINRVQNKVLFFQSKVATALQQSKDTQASFTAWYTLALNEYITKQKIKLPPAFNKALAESEYSRLMEGLPVKLEVLLEALKVQGEQLRGAKKLAQDKYNGGKDQVNFQWTQLPYRDGGIPAEGNPSPYAKKRSEPATDFAEPVVEEEDEPVTSFVSKQAQKVSQAAPAKPKFVEDEDDGVDENGNGPKVTTDDCNGAECGGKPCQCEPFEVKVVTPPADAKIAIGMGGCVDGEGKMRFTEASIIPAEAAVDPHTILQAAKSIPQQFADLKVTCVHCNESLEGKSREENLSHIRGECLGNKVADPGVPKMEIVTGVVDLGKPTKVLAEVPEGAITTVASPFSMGAQVNPDLRKVDFVIEETIDLENSRISPEAVKIAQNIKVPENTVGFGVLTEKQCEEVVKNLNPTSTSPSTSSQVMMFDDGPDAPATQVYTKNFDEFPGITHCESCKKHVKRNQQMVKCDGGWRHYKAEDCKPGVQKPRGVKTDTGKEPPQSMTSAEIQADMMADEPVAATQPQQTPVAPITSESPEAEQIMANARRNGKTELSQRVFEARIQQLIDDEPGGVMACSPEIYAAAKEASGGEEPSQLAIHDAAMSKMVGEVARNLNAETQAEYEASRQAKMEKLNVRSESPVGRKPLEPSVLEAMLNAVPDEPTIPVSKDEFKPVNTPLAEKVAQEAPVEKKAFVVDDDDEEIVVTPMSTPKRRMLILDDDPEDL